MAKKEKDPLLTGVPDAPGELFSKALPIYKSIYRILIEEKRAKEKYRVTVAIASNALYFYKKAVEMADELEKDKELRSPMEMNRVINGMNKASGEYLKAAKTLLLTPESESQIADPEPEAGQSLFEVLNRPKAKSESYGKRNEPKAKSIEKRSKSRRKVAATPTKKPGPKPKPKAPAKPRKLILKKPKKK